MDSGVLEMSLFAPFAKMKLSVTNKWEAELGRAWEAKILLTINASLFPDLSRASFSPVFSRKLI